MQKPASCLKVTETRERTMCKYSKIIPGCDRGHRPKALPGGNFTQTKQGMKNKWARLVLVCIICLAVITGIVLIVKLF
jgi:hypothetical protein